MLWQNSLVWWRRLTAAAANQCAPATFIFLYLLPVWNTWFGPLSVILPIQRPFEALVDIAHAIEYALLDVRLGLGFLASY